MVFRLKFERATCSSVSDTGSRIIKDIHSETRQPLTLYRIRRSILDRIRPVKFANNSVYGRSNEITSLTVKAKERSSDVLDLLSSSNTELVLIC